MFMVTNTPSFAPADYTTKFATPCTLFKNHHGQDWFFGTGIQPNAHPLKRPIDFSDCVCAACQSRDVLVIAAQAVVHPYTGDLYWDYEVVCQKCGKFTQRSYAEN